MEIVYENGQIIDAKTAYKPLQDALTLQERLAMFGCAQPDATLWSEMVKLEKDDPTGSKTTAVNRMVTIGSITQGRADELLA